MASYTSMPTAVTAGSYGVSPGVVSRALPATSAATTLLAPAATYTTGATLPATVTAGTATYASPLTAVSGVATMPVIAAATSGVPMTARGTTPLLDAAFDDEDCFIRFIKNASAGKHTPEYRELYTFLLECFTEADSDFDGLVGADGFDFMVERAVQLPRKFGYAPTQQEVYPSAEARMQARALEFQKINTSGSGMIAFDEWLKWAYNHICEKTARLDPRTAGRHWADDSEHFRVFILKACSSTHTPEYKELYKFLLDSFTAADKDLDGKINHLEFDSLIEVAATAPRKFGYAPSTPSLYPNDMMRIQGRKREFDQIDVHRHGYISFDDWLSWAYQHIKEKSAKLGYMGAGVGAGMSAGMTAAPAAVGGGYTTGVVAGTGYTTGATFGQRVITSPGTVSAGSVL